MQRIPTAFPLIPDDEAMVQACPEFTLDRDNIIDFFGSGKVERREEGDILTYVIRYTPCRGSTQQPAMVVIE